MSPAYKLRAKHFPKSPFLMLVAAMVTFAGNAQAELPPSAYADKQKNATESLIIEVKDVKTKRTRIKGLTKTDVMVRARIMSVERTKTNLMKNEIIFISYVHEKLDTPVPGPGQVPILTIGKQCPAYLDKLGKKLKEYSPAAGKYSFETVPESKFENAG